MKEYCPKARNVFALQVTRENAHAVAKELGCDVSEEAKPGDPSDVALWLVAPLLTGVVHFLITNEGPIVGREVDTNRLVGWPKRREFEELYKPTEQESEAYEPDWCSICGVDRNSSRHSYDCPPLDPQPTEQVLRQ